MQKATTHRYGGAFGPWRAAWMRMQETPLEIAIATLAVVATVLGLLSEWHSLSIFALALYFALGIGGAVTVAGRFADSLSAERVGVTLLLGSFMFLALRQLPDAHTAVEVASILVNYGALAIGFGVRLYVVARALKARVRVARRLP